jgi:hypothetical protein
MGRFGPSITLKVRVLGDCIYVQMLKKMLNSAPYLVISYDQFNCNVIWYEYSWYHGMKNSLTFHYSLIYSWHVQLQTGCDLLFSVNTASAVSTPSYHPTLL